MAGLTAVNPYTGSTDHLMAAMADPVEESMLHMVIPGMARAPRVSPSSAIRITFFSRAVRNAGDRKRLRVEPR